MPIEEEGPDVSIRRADLWDFRALGRLYRSRGEQGRLLFHPFPEGRIGAHLAFVTILLSCRLRRLLVRAWPRATFFVLVHTEGESRAIDGFTYLRILRKDARGFVANIGTLMSPSTRGKGVGGRLLATLFREARGLGVYRIETETYETNQATHRLTEKLGFRPPDDGTPAQRRDVHGIACRYVLDLEPRPSPSPRGVGTSAADRVVPLTRPSAEARGGRS